jgi:signal transduction histidine kinase
MVLLGGNLVTTHPEQPQVLRNNHTLFIRNLLRKVTLIQISDWKVKLVPLVYRLVTLLLAAVFVMGPDRPPEFPVGTHFLLGLAVVELLIATLPPFLAENRREKNFSLIISCLSVTLCLLLLMLSGSIESPFILYALSPVLSSALFLSTKVTWITSTTNCVLVILGEILNPFFPFQFTPFIATQIILFIVTNGLMVTLPYMVNIGLKQRLEQQSILEERQRLSREIHDGIAQTLHALCWQVQQVRHQLDTSVIKNKDIEQLEELAEKARADILQAMDVLRNNLAENDFRTILTGCLEDFKQTNHIDYSLKYEISDFNPAVETKNELVSICREALANIKKHSGAHLVQVQLKQYNGGIELSIADDGRGFDSVSYYRRRFQNKDHHGLSVMQERAQLINCKLQVLSLPQRGTEVKVEIPFRLAKSKV